MLDHTDLVPKLLERMHQAPRDQAMMFCRRLLSIALADGMNAFAWDILGELADDEALWTGQELPALLEQYDLPSDREMLKQLSYVNAGTQPGIPLPRD